MTITARRQLEPVAGRRKEQTACLPFSRWREKVPKADEGGVRDYAAILMCHPHPARYPRRPLPPAGEVSFSYASRKGNCRSRFPVAANTAFATAGAIGGVPGSPQPPILSVLGTMYTSTFGISFRRSTG